MPYILLMKQPELRCTVRFQMWQIHFGFVPNYFIHPRFSYENDA
jgi:hypothetical protein